MERMKSFNRKIRKPREESVGGGGVYIGLSQKSSCWAKIQNLDKVWGEPDIVRLGLSVSV
jgi:hypothetical protein